jgi:regulator of protease activity HflC (stomatin/prohibitin superfamily)
MGETFLTKLLEWVWDLAERYLLPWVIIREYESGIILLLGKYHYTLKKGFNLKMPLLHESLTCMVKPETLEFRPITIITKDKETISIGLIGGYEVFDEKKFLLGANDAASNIHHHFILTCSDYLTDSTLEELIQKTTPYTNMKRKLNEQLDYLGAKFFIIGYSSICKTKPISLLNN